VYHTPLYPVNTATSLAAVAAWLPGNEGGGVADIIFGARPITGKLPVAWEL